MKFLIFTIRFLDTVAGEDGARSLDGLYARGIARRSADEYLWKFVPEKREYTRDDIRILEDQVDLINSSDYPQNVKDAMSNFLSIIRELKFRPVRNLNERF